MNLFSANLEEAFTYEVLRQFLQLDDPPEQRLQEGLSVDFKEDLVQNLGEHVAALANTYGGLLLLGVRETKNLPFVVAEAIPGLKGAKGDLKHTIENKISTTVRPRPMFSIGIVPVPERQGYCAAVVRIEEGHEPPYMYVQGGQNMVPMRTPGSTRAASLEELRNLFRKARRVRRRARLGPTSIGDVYVTEAGARSWRHHRLVWSPFVALVDRLDRIGEAKFRKCIEVAFPTHPRPEVVERRASYTHFGIQVDQLNFGAVWAVSSYGAIGYVAKLSKRLRHEAGGRTHQAGQVVETGVVGDWIMEAASFIRLIRGWAEECGYAGTGQLMHEMSLQGIDDVLFNAGVRTSLEGQYGVLRGILRLESRVSSRAVRSGHIGNNLVQGHG